MNRARWTWTSLLSTSWLALFALGTPACATPIDQPEGGTYQLWLKRQEVINARAQKGDVDLVFAGDSITEGWESTGKEVWEKFYSNRQAMNAGLAGDQPQNLHWRLEHGNVDGIKPKLIVIMIGTNSSNGNDHTAEEIADGITAIVKTLRKKTPESKILLLGIFPRGPKPDAQREKIAKANELASKVADGKMVFYEDIGAKFLKPDGSLSPDVMNDYLHLTPAGYEIWAKAIEPKVSDLLGEKSK